ncbi:hypothetical protein LCGC14_2938620 [marine sediment metagenome]|uniref:Uncharacterized protein n=1 Tax=marine sediment metagenome TaxID=412755 RepID=A0A0F9A9R9_9ZZZZ
MGLSTSEFAKMLDRLRYDNCLLITDANYSESEEKIFRAGYTERERQLRADIEQIKTELTNCNSN